MTAFSPSQNQFLVFFLVVMTVDTTILAFREPGNEPELITFFSFTKRKFLVKFFVKGYLLFGEYGRRAEGKTEQKGENNDSDKSVWHDVHSFSQEN